MSGLIGLVADIERASAHDGPGIRTVVFLKGCPLSCRWCHNPECISNKPQTLFYPDKCIGCKRCSEGCYSGARVVCGRDMTIPEVMEQIIADRVYYGKSGGLTISGGEPLSQPKFTRELALAARSEGIHTAVETSLFIYDEETLKAFDLIMFDLKLPDDERHIKYTGVPVSGIKANIAKAAELGIPMIARTPVIPGVNDSSIGEISAFLSDFPVVRRYELLPYHPLGLEKAKALGKPQERFSTPSKQMMEELSEYAFIR